MLETKVCTKCGEERLASEFSAEKSGKDGRRASCKPCERLRSKHYRETHKEQVQDYARRYQAEHPEIYRKSSLEYAAKHREEKRLYAAQYRAMNPEKCAAMARSWRQANPEKVVAIRHNRRARKRGAEGSHTAYDVAAQYERQKGLCYYCGKKVEGDYHVDHVIPLAEGGSNWPSNIVVACPTCNFSKQGKHPMEFAGVML